MMFGYLNYQRHPHDKEKRVFYYRYQDLADKMVALLEEKQIIYEREEEDDGTPTFYVIVKKEHFDAAFDCNAQAMVSVKKPLIQDRGLRIFLFILFFAAVGFAAIGYIVTLLK